MGTVESAQRGGARAGATVRVPGSTSNLGGGFDCVGIAIDRWLTVYAPGQEPERDEAPGRSGLTLERHGTLTELQDPAELDLIHVGFAAACRDAGIERPRNVHLEAYSEIPIGRGLGSSASALVAGAALADHMLELGLDDERLATICADLEGHPDNVTPCVFGGAVLALRSSTGELAAARLDVHLSLAFVFAVPDFALSTKRARAVLPESVPYATAVSAVARAAALVEGLQRADEAMLAVGFDDVLHVPHRRPLVPGFDDVCAAAAGAGAFGATLSGAGSAIVAVTPHERAAAVGEAMCAAWRSLGTDAEWFLSAGQVPGVSISLTRPAWISEAAESST
jgi:homoserine kinase